nr:DUF6596 domain-containing protein [Verrucomicrobium spinosum]
MPQKPEAWLLRVAGNRITDEIRHQRVKQNSEAHLQQLAEEVRTVADTGGPFPDERLKLLFVCGHPAIDPAVRTPLMLQVVLGVDAARIASAFLVSPTAMGQRLVRAKNKIRDAGIAFRVPEPPEWEGRLSFVLDAIYAAYTTGWENVLEAGATQHGLAREAIHLGRTLVQFMPQEPKRWDCWLSCCTARRAVPRGMMWRGTLCRSMSRTPPFGRDAHDRGGGVVAASIEFQETGSLSTGGGHSVHPRQPCGYG